MMPKAFASLQIRQPADEAIYKILLIKRLLYKGHSQKRIILISSFVIGIIAGNHIYFLA